MYSLPVSFHYQSPRLARRPLIKGYQIMSSLRESPLQLSRTLFRHCKSHSRTESSQAKTPTAFPVYNPTPTRCPSIVQCKFHCGAAGSRMTSNAMGENTTNPCLSQTKENPSQW